MPVKPTKFPFQCRITRLSSVYTAKMAAILQSIKINLAHPVDIIKFHPKAEYSRGLEIYAKVIMTNYPKKQQFCLNPTLDLNL